MNFGQTGIPAVSAAIDGGRFALMPARPAIHGDTRGHRPGIATCALMLGVVLMAACGGGESPPEPESVAAVSVLPASQSMNVGDTLRFAATVRGSRGSVLTGRPVTWASSDPARATVTAGGLVSAVAPGAVTITASAEGRSGSAAVTVTPIPVATVSVTPENRSIFVGASLQLTAAARSAAGALLNDRQASWRTSDASRATVNASGLVTALAPGTVTMTATVEGREGSTAVTIVPVPVASVSLTPAAPAVLRRDTLRLSATARDSAGNVLSGRLITWSSADSTVLTVSTQGIITGVREGTTTITATSEGRTGSAAVRVLPGLTLRISQDAYLSGGAAARVGDTVVVRASVDSSGTFLSVAPAAFVWTSADTTIAQVVGVSGLVVGRREGQTTLRVRSIRGAVDSVVLRVFAMANVAAPTLTSPPDRSIFSEALSAGVTLEWGAAPLALTVQFVEIEACNVPTSTAEWEVACATRWLRTLGILAGGRTFFLPRRQNFAYRWRVRAFDLSAAYGPWSPWRSLLFR